MTDQAVTDKAHAGHVTPAGWYEDPADSTKVRWWNGLAWTDHTAEKPDEESQRLAEARALEREFGISTAEHAIMNGSGEVATPAIAAATASTHGHTRSAATTTVWLLAFMPVFAVIVALAAGYVYFYVSPTPLVVIAAVVVWLLGFLWSINDSRILQARGLDAPKPLWGLVGAAVYLAVRRTKVAGWRPLGVFVALTLVAGGALLGGILSGAAAPVSTALNVQLTLHRELVETGQLTSVNCPPIIDSSHAGALFTCTGTAADGSSRDVWVSFDDTDGGFSYAFDVGKG